MVCDPLWPRVYHQLKKSIGWDSVTGLVVAVSGGPDSVTLLHLLKTHLHHFPCQLLLHVAHLHHGLRGAEADEDARFVERLAKDLGVTASVKTIDVTGQLQKGKSNWEAVARQVRYEFLHQTALSVGAQAIATGHTMTDQAETVLLRLLRGSSLDGLAAIRSVRQPTETRARTRTIGVRVVRPLLAVTRPEIEMYIERHQLPTRHDSTNDDPRLLRNRIRQRVWPLLTEINPRVTHALARIGQQAETDAEFFNEVTTHWLEKHAVVMTHGVALPVQVLHELPVAVRGRILHKVAQNHRFPAVSAYHVAQIEGLLGTDGQGKMVMLPGKRRVRRVLNFVLFEVDEGSAVDF